MTMADSPESPSPNRIPYLRQVFDRAGITKEVRDSHYEGAGTDADPYEVVWIEDDPRNPMLYSFTTKWAIAGLVGLECLGVTFCSSVYIGGAASIVRDFGCSREVVILGLSLFVLGFAVGPLIWSPLSEMYGRQTVHCISFFCLTVFNASAAASRNIWTLIILRFLAGSIGSSALGSAGAVISDIFPQSHRGLASALYSMAPWLGPVLGPIVGGFVGESLGWRWTQGIMAIFTASIWIVGTLLVPETYPPVLLRRRAARLSQMTGQVYKSRVDIHQNQNGTPSLQKVLRTNLVRPWILLFTEPIVLVISLYTAIVYGVLYMFFGAFPIVYQELRGWSTGIGGLAFIGILVGMILAVVPTSILFNQRYIKATVKNRGPLLPEARLAPCMLGAIAAPIGLFWFSWTNGPSEHFMISIVASAFFGYGLVLIFSGGVGYLMDSYTLYTASVLAANSLLRSAFGAIFPLFTTQMFHNLGIHWASMIPAFLALACLPFPFLLHRYGATIRMRCKFAAESAAFKDRLHAKQKEAPATTQNDKETA